MFQIQRRLMRPSDAKAVVEHLSQFKDAFSSAPEHDLLASLVQQKAVSGLLIETSQPNNQATSNTLYTLGITAFLDMPVAETLINTPPSVPVVDWLYEQEALGNNVFLRPKEIALRNGGEGMAMVFMHYSAPSGDPTDPQVQQAVTHAQSSFRLQNGGHHCRMLLHPIPEQKHAYDSLLAQGFDPLEEGDHLLVFHLDKLQSVPYHPFVCLQQGTPPLFDFSPGEKELLLHALLGRSDEEIAGDLNIKRDTVRKRWRTIFQRIENRSEIQLFPHDAMTKRKRGPEKRGLVLRYIDTHLEELRPFKVVD